MSNSVKAYTVYRPYYDCENIRIESLRRNLDSVSPELPPCHYWTMEEARKAIEPFVEEAYKKFRALSSRIDSACDEFGGNISAYLDGDTQGVYAFYTQVELIVGGFSFRFRFGD